MLRDVGTSALVSLARRSSRLAALTSAFALALCAAAAGAQTPPPAPSTRPLLTVQAAVELALRRHPATRVAAELTDEARARVGVASSAYLPRVFFGAQWLAGTLNGNPTSSLGFPDVARVPGSKPASLRNASDLALFGNYMTGLSTGIPIWDFERTDGRVNEAKANVREQESGEEVVRYRIIATVRRSYYAVLNAERALDAAKEAVLRLKKYADQATAMVRAKYWRPITVPRTQAELARADVRRVQAENDLKVARVVLDNAIGVRTDGQFQLVVDDMPDEVKGGVEEFVDTAFRLRPELHQLRQRRRAEEARLQWARGNYYPVFSGTASVNQAGVGGIGNWLNFDAGILLSWPVFEGFLYRWRAKESIARIRGNDASTEELAQNVEMQVRSAHAQAKNAEEFIRATRVAFAHASDNLKLAQESFNRGLTTVVELADAELLFVVAQLNVIRSGFELKIALANLEWAVGRRTPLPPGAIRGGPAPSVASFGAPLRPAPTAR